MDEWGHPPTNCRACGEMTCMAFAFILLQSRRTLEECPVMADDPAFADRRAQLAALVENESYLNGPTS
jgi:4Fe-4S ferredoxin